MSRQSMIALAVAVLLGLLAVYLANIYLSRSDARADSAGATIRVAVAAAPLDYGVALTPEKVRFAEFPASSLPAGTFRQMRDLFPQGQKRIAIRPMQVNELILASKVTGPGQNASIAALLPDGKRAAAVRINDVSGVAGFIQPNDSVDVLITRRQLNADAEQTDVLLQNVKVLAIDQRAKNPDGTPVVAKTATLEVEPLDAQKLALAQQVGSLSLVLRKPGVEQDSLVVTTVSMNDLRYSLGAGMRPPQPMTMAPRPPSAAAPQRRVVRRPPPATVRSTNPNVEIVRGTQGSNYEVRPYGT